MRRLGVAVAVLAFLAAAGSALAAGDIETVPLYTNDDLDRMFGPAPPQPSEPVDKTTPDDWRWVEQFLDRQYARVDADRRWDLERRTLDIAEQRTPAGYRGGYAAWSLGYPAATWWNNVWWRYSAAVGGGYHAPVARANPYAWANGGSKPGSPGGGFRGHAGGNGHRARSQK